MAEEQVYTLSEAARIAGVGYRTLHNWMAEGLVQTSLRPTAGSGNAALLSRRDVEIATLLGVLRRRGLSLDGMRLLDLDAIRQQGSDECPVCRAGDVSLNTDEEVVQRLGDTDHHPTRAVRRASNPKPVPHPKVIEGRQGG